MWKGANSNGDEQKLRKYSLRDKEFYIPEAEM